MYYHRFLYMSTSFISAKIPQKQIKDYFFVTIGRYTLERRDRETILSAVNEWFEGIIDDNDEHAMRDVLKDVANDPTGFIDEMIDKFIHKMDHLLTSDFDRKIDLIARLHVVGFNNLISICADNKIDMEGFRTKYLNAVNVNGNAINRNAFRGLFVFFVNDGLNPHSSTNIEILEMIGGFIDVLCVEGFEKFDNDQQKMAEYYHDQFVDKRANCLSLGMDDNDFEHTFTCCMNYDNCSTEREKLFIMGLLDIWKHSGEDASTELGNDR